MEVNQPRFPNQITFEQLYCSWDKVRCCALCLCIFALGYQLVGLLDWDWTRGFFLLGAV